MFLCARIDLDYVPWDEALASEFGHGEAAMLLRILDFARFSGLKFHFFISTRSLRAFPAAADAVLGEGHDLDWLCTDPSEKARLEAEAELRMIGHKAMGVALEGSSALSGFEFATCPAGDCGDESLCFPVTGRSDREAVRAGISLRLWAEEIKGSFSGADFVVACLHPQVLGRFDVGLSSLRSICEAAFSEGVAVVTLRDAVRSGFQGWA